MIKIIFLFILVIHGLIHLLGFIKAFNLSQVNQLTVFISKPIGLIWLFSAILFLATSALVLFNKQWVWIPAIIAVITSQILIFISWEDAKFGTFPNVIILIFAILSFGAWNFNTLIDKELDSLLSQPNGENTGIITKEMLTPLPSPVQRWLTDIGITGQAPIHTAYFEQKGMMKLKPDQKDWAPAEIDQYVTTDHPGFIWKVRMKMLPLIDIVGRDKFQAGSAEMTIKIGSLFPVVNERNNQKTNQSTLQRYLMEMPWYPSAALSPYITWEEIDDHSAKATMNYEGVTGSAIFYFNDSGEFLRVSAMRYKESDKNAEPIECIGEAKEYKIIEGLKIPAKIEVSWVLDEGIFTWYKLEILNVRYN